MTDRTTRLRALGGACKKLADSPDIQLGRVSNRAEDAIAELLERLEQAEATLRDLRANRTEILNSAWNTANERALKAEAALAERDGLITRLIPFIGSHVPDLVREAEDVVFGYDAEVEP